MKTIFSLILLTLAIATSVQASLHQIEVGGEMYPSPASTHLVLLQHELARKAIETCGAQKLVRSLSDIQIQIHEASPQMGPVAVLSDEQMVGLALWYPVLSARATVDCKTKK